MDARHLAPSASELKRRMQAERLGQPFLVHRDHAGEQQILPLGPLDRATVGRGPEVDVRLDPDPEVSRLHAELERIGGVWVLADDGLSQNGSYLNGERVAGRRRLRDGDLLRFGSTEVRFRAPSPSAVGETRPADESQRPELSSTQRRVLVALCRPYRDGGAYARPAANRQIAEEVFLSVDAVKGHLRTLFARFGLEQLPQNEKRLRLVEGALESGAVSRHEL
ncbi:MAG: FHA domain-containing protein [Actinomycetota bacterium]|nr:FHA domain-containing protein [Actinomycetota bacterium]